MSIGSIVWRGMRTPVIFDHLVLEQSMLIDTAEVKELKEEIQMYKRQLLRIKMLAGQMEM